MNRGYLRIRRLEIKDESKKKAMLKKAANSPEFAKILLVFSTYITD